MNGLNCTENMCRNCKSKFSCAKSPFCTISQRVETTQENTEALLEALPIILGNLVEEKISIVFDNKISDLTSKLDLIEQKMQEMIQEKFKVSEEVENIEEVEYTIETNTGLSVLSEISNEKPQFIVDSDGKQKMLSKNIFGKEVYKPVK